MQHYETVILSCKPEETHWLGVIIGEKLERYNKAHSNYQHQMTQILKTTTLFVCIYVCACMCNQQQSSQSPPFVSPVNEAELIK